MDQTGQIRRAVEGDRDALQQLIVQYHGPLYGTVDGRMDPKLRRHADPEDVLQQAYVAAFQSIKQCSFDGPAGFYKWLETIALDRLKDLKRDLGRKKRDIGRQLSAPPAATSSYADLVERLASPQSTPSRHLAKREACAAAVSSLARLTPDQRAVVRMRLLEGKQAAEVAAELGKSEAAVHMLLHRALKELRKLMVSITRYLSRL